ncbi:hypothetical protein [Azospirillum isscasi]|uniref:Uncharacterized protein n=1 Tax=Azospirillum isscasi TaxID=3053926 RepID=A0ABU0WGT6_9PROT|nr:hypothetical protein [Azospirillum isscasi]MDQ2103375.1 hypothetical protein [Azospirillum isscasi]
MREHVGLMAEASIDLLDMARDVRDLNPEIARFSGNIGNQMRAAAEHTVHFPAIRFTRMRKALKSDAIITESLQLRNGRRDN